MPDALTRLLMSLTERVFVPVTMDGFLSALDRAQGELLDYARRLSPVGLLEHPSVELAFEHYRAHQRKRRVLEAMLWPVQEKAALPGESSRYLNTFLLPIRARLDAPPTDRAVWLGECTEFFVDTIAELQAAGLFASYASVEGVAALYRREDFSSFGPHHFAVPLRERACGIEADVPAPLPFYFDEELPAHREVTFHLLFTAVGPTQCQMYSTKGLTPHVAASIGAAFDTELRRQGLNPLNVEVQQLAPLWQAGYFSCGSGARELDAAVATLLEYGGPESCLLGGSPAPGWVELSVQNKSGQVLPGLPPFSVLEPEEVVLDIVGLLASRKGAHLRRPQPLASSQGSALLH